MKEQDLAWAGAGGQPGDCGRWAPADTEDSPKCADCWDWDWDSCRRWSYVTMRAEQTETGAALGSDTSSWTLLMWTSLCKSVARAPRLLLCPTWPCECNNVTM